MKFKIYFFLIFFGLNHLFSQEDNNIQEAMPKMAPVTPDISSLGQYGDTPVNLASGMVNLRIPIYTINLSGYQLPIYLTYHYNGLLVEQDPGVVGLGWNLVAGGSISRELRGKPDNQHQHSVSWHNTYMDLKNFPQLSENAKLSYCNYYEANQIDTEPDKFNININGAEASFVYDENGYPVFFRQKKYYINQNSDQEFEVINDDGVKFLFLDVENGSTDINSNQGGYGYISSWKISKIILPNSDKFIDFTYYDSKDINFNPHLREYSKESYSETKRYNFISGQSMLYGLNFFNILTGNRGENIGNTGTPSCIPADNGGGRISATYIEQKLINTITFPDGKIKFDMKVIPHNIGSKANNPFYLDKIKVFDKFNQLKFEYRMIYADTLHKTNYNLLTKIKKYGVDRNGNLQEEPFYKFLYYGSPPEQLNKLSVDTWGYWNGFYNTSLLSGDRSVNFETTKIGALRKIIYPTEGFTELEYEQNTSSTLDPLFSGGGQCTPNIFNRERSVSVVNFLGNVLEKTDTIDIPCEQMVRVSISAFSGLISGSSSGANASDAGIEFLNLPSGTNIEDLCNPFNQSCNDGCQTVVSSQSPENLVSFNDWPDYASQSEQNYFYLPAGTRIVLHAQTDSISTGRGSASVKVEYFDCQDYNIPVGGIRVKSMKTCEKEGANNCQIKHFNYNLSGGYSSGRILSIPFYKYSVHYGFNCGPDSEFGEGQFGYHASGSMIPMAGFSGSPVLYERVETIENNGVEKGKTVQYFSVEDFMRIEDVTSPPFLYFLQEGWKNGNLLKEEKYKWENGIYKKVSEQINEYESFAYQPNANVHGSLSVGFKAFRKEYNFGVYGNPQDLSAYDYITYDVRPRFYKLVSSTNRQFLNNQEISLTKHYEYDSITGNLVKEYFEDSQGKTHEKRFFYVDQVDNTNSLGDPELDAQSLGAYQILQKRDSSHLYHKNILSNPIQIENYVNNNLISKVRETYKDWGEIVVENDTLLNISKEAVFLSKSTENLPEKKLVYHDYDNSGNPTEISKKDGTRMFYVWGYNHSKIITKTIGCSPYENNLITQIISKSDLDTTPDTEESLRQSFMALRQILLTHHKDCKIMNYTYDPIVGVTSIIDEKGDTQFYQYGTFGRLQRILDKDGNILKEFDYNFDSSYNTQWPIVAHIQMIHHDIEHSRVTFKLYIDPNNAGSGQGLDYQWQLLSGLNIVSINGDQITVAYDCYDTRILPVSVKCKVIDLQFADNYEEVTGNFHWDGCLNGGELTVALDNPCSETETAGEMHTFCNFNSLTLSLNNISGGNSNLTYHWFYKEINSTSWQLLGTTTTPQYSQNSGLDLCNKTVWFKCVVIDNLTGQELEIINHTNQSILCGPQ